MAARPDFQTLLDDAQARIQNLDTPTEGLKGRLAEHPRLALREHHAVGGGCIADAARLDTDAAPLFIKTHADRGDDMFPAEARGLEALGERIRTPQVIAAGSVDGTAYLLLEWLDLGPVNDAALGEALAELHSEAQPAFGWPEDNFIGAMPQLGGDDDDWARFYGQRRLMPQLDWAAERGLGGRTIDAGHELVEALAAFFTDYRPYPALIHGDMWGANHGALTDGTPVLFDPATYRADREAEIAMTELFGGFAPSFYRAYQAHLPLDPGYRVRKTLYNLYHVLNHFNLFGGGYGSRADGMIRQLLAEIR
ncbi:fructosamine kinase family protein [Guyparkeria halopsychrophila]|uniref:fructosamine kinase family protein n=1 Tax=Guyparkeria halopsychrophila TaxID=3139421 RepID=UPI0037CC1869